MADDILTAQTLIHCGVPSDVARRHVPLMAPAMREHGIATRARARMFIAQVLHESVGLRYFEEIASGAEYEGRGDLGNTHPGDGRRYKGRGPIQLTGRLNYRSFGKRLGLNLEAHPGVAAKPSVGWRVAALYFQARGCNEAADAGNFELVTRKINGGLNGYDSRKRYFALLAGQGVLPGKPYLARGDKGQAVLVMTRRLSHVRSPSTGKPYLDGRRTTFDMESTRALRRFQAEHGLHVDGRFGPRSAKALAREIERVKRGHPARPAPAPARPKPPGKRPAKHPATAVELLARMDALDARSDRLLRALERRRRVLEQHAARPAPHPAIAHGGDDLAGRVTRLEATVSELRIELTAVESGPVPAPPAPVVVQAAPPAVATLVQAAPPVVKPAGNGASRLDQLTLAELAQRLARLSREGDRVRTLMLARYTELEREAGPVERPRPRPQPARPRPKPDPEDGTDGSAGAPRPGGRAWPIRQSKLAVARYLKAKDPAGTLTLRRALRKDRLSPRAARSATPAWEAAIKAAQKIAGQPQSGKLDGALVLVLRPYWPPESPPRRAVKGTPAWRLIPGQLTRHFNIREFACHDGTAYVAGLVREQGITKQQAKARAKELAKRLERLRHAEGDRPLRPTSVYRTKAYNAHVGGSAKNSAHTRGFAADVPPPPGVALLRHSQHVRAVFEGGVGFYQAAHFVHGDFDMSLGRREWNGP